MAGDSVQALVDFTLPCVKTDDAVYLLACPSQSVRFHAEQAVVWKQQAPVRHCAGPNGISVPTTADQ